MKDSHWVGSDYARISALQRWLAQKSLDGVRLQGDETILDIGCGDGRVTAELARRVPHGRVVGVDASSKMIDFARSEHRAENLEFELGDARDLDRHAGGFDLVVSFNALHWLPDPRVGVLGAQRCLRPEGRAHLRFVGKGPVKALEEVCEEVRELASWREHFAGFERPFTHLPPESFPGKTQIQLEQWDFESRSAFCDWARTTFVSWLHGLPEERRSRFVEDVLDRYSSDRVFTFYQLVVEL